MIYANKVTYGGLLAHDNGVTQAAGLAISERPTMWWEGGVFESGGISLVSGRRDCWRFSHVANGSINHACSKTPIKTPDFTVWVSFAWQHDISCHTTMCQESYVSLRMMEASYLESSRTSSCFSPLGWFRFASFSHNKAVILGISTSWVLWVFLANYWIRG